MSENIRRRMEASTHSRSPIMETVERHEASVQATNELKKLVIGIVLGAIDSGNTAGSDPESSTIGVFNELDDEWFVSIDFTPYPNIERDPFEILRACLDDADRLESTSAGTFSVTVEHPEHNYIYELATLGEVSKPEKILVSYMSAEGIPKIAVRYGQSLDFEEIAGLTQDLTVIFSDN